MDQLSLKQMSLSDSKDDKLNASQEAEEAEKRRLAQLQCSIDNRDACLMCSG